MDAEAAPAVLEMTLDAATAALVDQVLIGLADVSQLPQVEVFLDEEGAPVARREGERLVAVRPVGWPSPADVRASAPVVVATWGRIPAEPVPAEAVVLLAAGGVRPDDARWSAWSSAWTRGGANDVVRIPVLPADVGSRAAALAAVYSSGPLREVATAPQPTGAGRAVFFTGLSGSGKSTVARTLVERLAADRTVTLLDGDVVRTHLSKGLGFSAADRDTNIRRIGWVAAEVAKHGGIAVCAPIAPYDETRRWVRATVEATAGPDGFLLVWISTPLEVCEARDVKGLYAKARAGEITGFTGIDDPYEAPTDAELVIDTSQVSLDDAVDQVLRRLNF